LKFLASFVQNKEGLCLHANVIFVHITGSNQKLHDAERRLENAEKERTTVGQVIQELRQKVDTASREADEQAVKQRRATLQLQKIIREVMEKME
jgi:hypothetical protein